MTHDDIIRMAREAGAETQDGKHWGFDDFDPARFAALAAAAEREACAKWYKEKGWLLDEDDVPEAMLAARNTA